MNDSTTHVAQFVAPELIPAELPPPDDELLYDDGEPMETFWHRCAMNLLVEVVYWLYHDRTDFYVGGNMFLYYSARQARTLEYRGPDFFFVRGVNREPMRKFWAVWNEGGKYPDLIIELMSPTTAHVDLTVKKVLYESTFHTNNYFCYDPDGQRLLGWHLVQGKYEPITKTKNGRLWCEELGLWLGPWKGSYLGYEDVWLRFFYDDERLALTATEAARERVEAERKRTEAAEAEVVRLKALLLEKGSLRRSGADAGPSAP
jgi:Uma2 family endonuclease